MKAMLNNISINYVERGPKNGLPVVFIHGFPFNFTMWESQMQLFSSTNRILAYDLRGHGSSDVADGQYTIEFFVDDLIALLDHLDIEKAVICGLSMGGYIALRAFERFPRRFKGLILCNTRSEADSNDAKIRRSNTIKLVKTRGLKEFAEDFVKSVFAAETLKSRPKIVESIKSAILETSPLGICGTLIALASRTDSTPMLSSINVPTLIFGGELDILTPPSAAQAMHERIAGSELHVLPRAAHLSNVENTEMFNDLLAAFLKTNW